MHTHNPRTQETEAWWCAPTIPALGRRRPGGAHPQEDLEFKVSYKVGTQEEVVPSCLSKFRKAEGRMPCP